MTDADSPYVRKSVGCSWLHAVLLLLAITSACTSNPSDEAIRVAVEQTLEATTREFLTPLAPTASQVEATTPPTATYNSYEVPTIEPAQLASTPMPALEAETIAESSTPTLGIYPLEINPVDAGRDGWQGYLIPIAMEGDEHVPIFIYQGVAATITTDQGVEYPAEVRLATQHDHRSHGVSLAPLPPDVVFRGLLLQDTRVPGSKTQEYGHSLYVEVPEHMVPETIQLSATFFAEEGDAVSQVSEHSVSKLNDRDVTPPTSLPLTPQEFQIAGLSVTVMGLAVEDNGDVVLHLSAKSSNPVADEELMMRVLLIDATGYAATGIVRPIVVGPLQSTTVNTVVEPNIDHQHIDNPLTLTFFTGIPNDGTFQMFGPYLTQAELPNEVNGITTSESALSATSTPSQETVFSYPQLVRVLSFTEPRMNGEDVSILQQQLYDLGYTQVGEIDGYFGPLTDGAVRDFQADHGFEANGLVDSELWAFLFEPQPAADESSLEEPEATSVSTSPEDGMEATQSPAIVDDVPTPTVFESPLVSDDTFYVELTCGNNVGHVFVPLPIAEGDFDYNDSRFRCPPGLDYLSLDLPVQPLPQGITLEPNCGQNRFFKERFVKALEQYGANTPFDARGSWRTCNAEPPGDSPVSIIVHHTDIMSEVNSHLISEDHFYIAVTCPNNLLRFVPVPLLEGVVRKDDSRLQCDGEEPNSLSVPTQPLPWGVAIVDGSENGHECAARRESQLGFVNTLNLVGLETSHDIMGNRPDGFRFGLCSWASETLTVVWP